MIRFPIPLSSLYSLLHGVRGEPYKYITFHSFDKTSFVKEEQINMMNKSCYYKHCVSVSPHYFATYVKPCKRLYVATELWEHTIHRPQMIKEVIQIEEMGPDDFNLLIHVEKLDRGRLRKRQTLFHNKFYHLTEFQVHNHCISS